MTEPIEPGEKAKSVVKNSLVIVLGLATLALLGGTSGWLISGALFFLLGLPLIFTMVILQRAYPVKSENSKKSRATAWGKIAVGLVVEIPSFAWCSHYFAIVGPEGVLAIFGLVGILVGIWPLFDGTMSLIRASKESTEN